MIRKDRLLMVWKKLFDKNLKAEKLELISVHVPKTAGTSFRNVLYEVYGKSKVLRVDIGLGNELVRFDQKLTSEAKFPRGTSVIHGHFSPRLINSHFSIDPDVPIITWLRDPVDRVISNYYYLSKRLHEELEESQKGLNILSKMERTLEEYALAPKNQNRIAKFLEGTRIESFDFVGVVENMNQDMKELSKLMNWPSYSIKFENQTGKTKREVSSSLREKIKECNQEDLLIYNSVLKLKGLI